MLRVHECAIRRRRKLWLFSVSTDCNEGIWVRDDESLASTRWWECYMNLQQNQYFKHFMSACKHCQPIIINTLLKLKQIYLKENSLHRHLRECKVIIKLSELFVTALKSFTLSRAHNKFSASMINCYEMSLLVEEWIHIVSIASWCLVNYEHKLCVYMCVASLSLSLRITAILPIINFYFPNNFILRNY